jgi:hypothetical protein
VVLPTTGQGTVTDNRARIVNRVRYTERTAECSQVSKFALEIKKRMNTLAFGDVIAHYLARVVNGDSMGACRAKASTIPPAWTSAPCCSP